METNTLFLGSVNSYNAKTAKPDSNGLEPVILEVIAGKCPKKRVLAGTIAKNMQIEIGITYLFKWTKLPDDPTYGTQYAFQAIMPVTDPLTLLQMTDKLGGGEIF